jgi:hypothetical protein
MTSANIAENTRGVNLPDINKSKTTNISLMLGKLMKGDGYEI